MTDPEPPARVPLSLDVVQARFVAVHQAFLTQLDELDADRAVRLADHPDREGLEAAAAEQRRAIEAGFTRIAKLLLAAAANQADSGVRGEERLAALVADIRRTTAGLEAMLQRMEPEAED